LDRASIILAVGSPPGRSRRGIVRASGPGALELLESIIVRGVRDGGRSVVRVRLRVPAPGIAALAIRMPGPGSATGDDTFELLLPGNPLLLDRMIDALIAIDPRARRAEPGEFSARAFLNGRLTLDEAEGVAELIRASNDDELEAARRLAGGAVAERVRAWSARLAELTALVEAGIDFTDEEDVSAIEPRALADAAAELRRGIEGDLGERATAQAGTAASVAAPGAPLRSRREATRLPRVALVGAPNAGKSTLFNALVGERRTVESPVAGTTRDAIEAEVDVDGALRVLLVDLPGLEAGAAREHATAWRVLGESDLVLRCVAADVPRLIPEAVETAIASVPSIHVRTRCDRPHAPLESRLRIAPGAPPAPEAASARDDAGAPLDTSARTGAGIGGLRRAIADALGLRAARLAGDAALLPRHRAALAAAVEHLALAESNARRESPVGPWRAPEETAAALRLALDAIGSISGATTPDDVLGLVFSRFCVGK